MSGGVAFLRFVALDFETADHGADSACSLGLVRAEGGQIVRSEWRYIRPPRRRILFTHIHGITWDTVRHAEPFAEVWPWIAEMIEGVDFLAAHNAPFDRGVLNACCAAAGLPAPELPYVDTVRVAKKAWSLPRARLPDVCAHLGIPLRHHDASSDAEACAKIVLAAKADQLQQPRLF